MTWFQRAEQTRESHCSCPLPAGAWGDGGWHHARYAAPYLVELREAEANRLLAASRNLQGVLVEIGIRTGPAPVVDRRGAEEQAKSILPDTLIGTVYTFERCPAYRAAIERSGATKKTGRRQKGRGPE